MAADSETGRPFVGRVATVETLRRQLEDVRAGSSAVTLLTGETGVGKSTLIAELTKEIRGRRIPLLIGRAPPLDAPPPFSLLRLVIESVRNDPTLARGDALPLAEGPILIGFAPRAGEGAVPDLVSVEGRLLEALGGVEERGEDSRDRALSGIADQIREFARRGATVLILEDLHLADDSSLAAVTFLANELVHEPVWILATSRSYSSLAEAGRQRLERFEGATHARQVVLHPLKSSEVAEYLEVTDPSRRYSPQEVARRFSESGGVPLLLEQLDRRPPTAVPAATAASGEAPALDAEAQRTLEVAAVLGPEFGFPLLLRVSGEEDEERFTETIDRLVGAGFLLERPGEVLAFPRDRLREEVYERLSERRRQILHWSAGETLEATGSGGVATVYALARHFYLGRVGAKSVKYNRLAAEIADRALAPEVARNHLLRAWESQRELKPENIETESEIVLELAHVAEELGLLPEGERFLREFLERERADPRLSPRRRGSLEVFLALIAIARGNLPAASELAQKVLSSPEVEREPLVLLGGHHHLGVVLYYEGRYAEALVHHTKELRLAQQVGDPRVILRARIWRVAALAMMGPTDEAVAEAREITVARDRMGSSRESGQAHLVLGDLLADARCTPAQREEAIAEYARAIEFAEQAQDPRRVGWALYKTGELHCEAGRLEQATEPLRSACEIFTQVGDQVGLSMATKVRGQVAMAEGAYDRAETYLLEAHRLLRGLDHALEELDVVLRLAQLAYARGDSANARRHLTELERGRLPVLRPDLTRELEKLKQELGVKERRGAAA